MTRFCLITALFGSLLVGPAKAVTYYIDGVFATKTYDAVLCYSGPGCDRYAVSSVSESLSGTVDITNGVLTGFNLNADTSNYTIPGPEYLITNFNSANSNTTATTYGHVWNVSPDGQSWNFYYLRGYNELQFTVANGVVSDGLLDNWTDYDPWYSWENKFTNLTGTVAVVTPLPAALPLFTTGLGVMGLLGWRRRRKAAMSAA